MQAHIAQECQQINCVNILNRMLDLAMQTAEAASEEKNHRLVLQAVREVTRLVTLINKITGPQDQKAKPEGNFVLGSSPKENLAPQSDTWEKSGKTVGKIGVLEEFFKNNLPVNRYQKNIGASSPAGPGDYKTNHQEQIVGTANRRNKPATPIAEKSKAA